MPTKKNAEIQSRDISVPRLAKKYGPINSRNTKTQDEIIRVI
jgi:hypothetical protein